MAKCKHLLANIIIKGTTEETYFLDGDGRADDCWQSTALDFSKIFVQCDDCGMDKFYRTNEHLPLWLIAVLKAISKEWCNWTIEQEETLGLK